MYNAITSATQKGILEAHKDDFAGVIPSGTAIQNLRTSFFGDTLTRDGYHLSYGIGRYTAALAWFKALTGADLDSVTYIPTEYGYTLGEKAILAAKEAVNYACSYPFEISESTYVNDANKAQKEADLTRSMFTNTEGKGKKNATFGLSDFEVFFGEASSCNVVIDPFCPEGYAYSLDKNDLKFFDLGNVGRVIAPVANDQIGKYDIESVGDQGMGDDPKVSLNTDKLFTVTQGSAGRFGPSFNIAANIFGNFSMRKTSSSGVAVLK